MNPSRRRIGFVRSRMGGLALTLSSLLLTPGAAAQSILLDVTSEPLGTVEIQTTSGASVVELSENGTWTPAPSSLTTPSRIAIPPGSVVILHGKDGVVLRVSTDSLATRNLVMHGNMIRLQNTLVAGKPRLVVLETGEGVLGPPRQGAGQPPTSVP